MDRTKTLAGLMGLVLGLAGCGPKPAIVVGSKNFTEQALLAEILAQHLERRLHLRSLRPRPRQSQGVRATIRRRQSSCRGVC